MELKYKNWEIRLAPNSRPEEIMLELTTNCNFSCIHCFRNSMHEKMGFMSEDILDRVFEEIRRNNIGRVSISGWGEPLIYSNILSVLEKLKSLGTYVILNTNGSLLGKYTKDLLRIGINEIVVSIDSVKDALYGKIRIGGSLDTCLTALKEIRDLKNKLKSEKPLVTMQFTINKLNYKDIPYLVDFATKYGIGKIVLSNVIPTNKNQENIACYSDPNCKEEAEAMIQELGKQLMFIWNIQFVKSYLSAQQTFSCPFIDKNALYIRWDGYVAPCIH